MVLGQLPPKKIAPLSALILTLTQALTLTGGPFSSGATVQIPVYITFLSTIVKDWIMEKIIDLEKLKAEYPEIAPEKCWNRLESYKLSFRQVIQTSFKRSNCSNPWVALSLTISGICELRTSTLKNTSRQLVL